MRLTGLYSNTSQQNYTLYFTPDPRGGFAVVSIYKSLGGKKALHIFMMSLYHGIIL